MWFSHQTLFQTFYVDFCVYWLLVFTRVMDWMCLSTTSNGCIPSPVACQWVCILFFHLQSGFGLIVAVLFGMMALERIIPDQPLPYVPGWWMWVLGINCFQLFAVVLATFTWEKWLQHTDYFQNMTSFHLRSFCWRFLFPFFFDVSFFFCLQRSCFPMVWWILGIHYQ